MRARGARSGTAVEILDVAERLLQTRGYNGFSYADVASELDITKPALHYHFPGKSELGEALITRYASRFAEALAAIDNDVPSAPAKLDAYAGLYIDVLRAKRMCLCGMLAAEYETLPQPMKAGVIQFFEDSAKWLESVLCDGNADGTLQFVGSGREVAQLIIGALEGAMLVARSYGDVGRFEDSAERLLASLARPRAADGGAT